MGGILPGVPAWYWLDGVTMAGYGGAGVPSCNCDAAGVIMPGYGGAAVTGTEPVSG